MKVVVVIPSRYQSTRFMGKPLADVRQQTADRDRDQQHDHDQDHGR